MQGTLCISNRGLNLVGQLVATDWLDAGDVAFSLVTSGDSMGNGNGLNSGVRPNEQSTCRRSEEYGQFEYILFEYILLN